MTEKFTDVYVLWGKRVSAFDPDTQWEILEIHGEMPNDNTLAEMRDVWERSYEMKLECRTTPMIVSNPRDNEPDLLRVVA